MNCFCAKLAGLLSEGMLLCAEDADGKLSLMIPEKEMPSGAEICSEMETPIITIKVLNTSDIEWTASDIMADEDAKNPAANLNTDKNIMILRA